jgi:hypothetical protein
VPPTAADLALARDLHRSGRLSEDVLKAALAEAAPGRPLEAVLIARRLVSPDELRDPRAHALDATRLSGDGDPRARAPDATRLSGDGDRTHAADLTRLSGDGDPRPHAADQTRLSGDGDPRPHAADQTRLSGDGDPRTRAAPEPDPGRTFSPGLAKGPAAAAPGDGRTWLPYESGRNPRTSASPPPAVDWKLGGRVGRYRLDSELGRGGMGVVHLGTDEESGRRVAIKTLLPNASSTAARRFLREGEAQAAVDEHPNVLRVHAAGEAGGRQYLVMDFATGGDLAGRLKPGPLPPLEAARVARDLCRGLAHVHARGVLHRDLKPANVLFDDSGAPRLVDFGLAALEGAERLTATGAFMGTPAYMAPEQTGGERVGEAADIYSMGAMLYHMLVGRAPFDGEGGPAMIAKLITQPPTPPRELAPEVPESLERVVLKCLAKKPHQRYASASALADDLERALAGGAVEAPPPPSRKPVALAGVAAALALGAGGWAVVSHAPEAPPPSVAPAPVAVVPSAAAPVDPLASPTFGLPTTQRTYRCQWYTLSGSPGLLSFRATLSLGPAAVGSDGGVTCEGTLSDLNVWGGTAGLVDPDHDFGEDVALPLTIRVSAAGDLEVTCLSEDVRARLWDLLPEGLRENPQSPGAVWPGAVVRPFLSDALLADVLQLSLPQLARDRRSVRPTGSPLAFFRPPGPPILFTRDRNGVEDLSTIEASWVLDEDRSLVSCSFTDRAAATNPQKAKYGETWWGIGPPDEFRRLERKR